MCYLPGHSSSSVYDRLRIANSGHHSGVKVILSFILYLLLFTNKISFLFKYYVNNVELSWVDGIADQSLMPLRLTLLFSIDFQFFSFEIFLSFSVFNAIFSILSMQ